MHGSNDTEADGVSEGEGGSGMEGESAGGDADKKVGSVCLCYVIECGALCVAFVEWVDEFVSVRQ